MRHLFSSVAFNFHMRRYMQEALSVSGDGGGGGGGKKRKVAEAGMALRISTRPTLKLLLLLGASV